MFRTYPILDGAGALLLIAFFVVLTASEHARPLRRRLQSWLIHARTNLFLALPSFLLLRLLLIPVVVAAAGWAGNHHFGLAHLLPLPVWIGSILALLTLDYSMYLWHLLNHRVSWLWRFHRVHHSDLDMDVTTALRFHFGEIGLSVIVRSLQVTVAGASPAVALAYEVVLEASTQFHHSNLGLPLPLERFLAWFIMTPRAHGIHHSIAAHETNRNFSNFLILWDRLHGTAHLAVRQETIVVGVPDCRDAHQLTAWQLFLMPFRGPAPVPREDPSTSGNPPPSNPRTPDSFPS